MTEINNWRKTPSTNLHKFWGEIMPALKLRCPFCGRKGHHSVSKPDGGFYKWNKQTTDLFKEYAGHDISLRQSTLKCKAPCNKEFEVVVTPRIYLEALTDKVEELRRKNDKLNEKTSILEQQKIHIQDELKRVKERAEQLSNFVTELINSIVITDQIESTDVIDPLKLIFNFDNSAVEDNQTEI